MSAGNHVTFQFPQLSPAGSTPSRRGLFQTNKSSRSARRPSPAHFTRHPPCNVQEHGDERRLGHHGESQPERTPSQLCTGCGERRHRYGDKFPPCVPRSQELQSNRLLREMCLVIHINIATGCLWERRKSKHKNSPWIRPDVDMHAGKKATCRLR